MKALEGKVVLLVGVGAPGAVLSNGRATAIAFAAAGARVVLIDVNQEALDSCSDAMAKAGTPAANAIACDVCTEADVRRAVAAALEAHGRVDVLHFNVASAKPGRLPRATTADFEQMFSVNVRSAFWFCRELLPAMEIVGGGVITLVSSVSSVRHVGIPSPLYDMSKAALNALARHLAVEYGAKGIRANALLLGMMDTPLARNAIEGAGRKVDAVYEAYHAKVPAGRMGTAEDTAGAALFLASDASAYVNGAELILDGGLTVRTA